MKLIAGDAHDELAEIVSLEHADQRLRSVLQPIDNVFADPDLVFSDPSGHLPKKRIEARSIVVRDDEPLNLEALAQDQGHQ